MQSISLEKQQNLLFPSKNKGMVGTLCAAFKKVVPSKAKAAKIATSITFKALVAGSLATVFSPVAAIGVAAVGAATLSSYVEYRFEKRAAKKKREVLPKFLSRERMMTGSTGAGLGFLGALFGDEIVEGFGAVDRMTGNSISGFFGSLWKVINPISMASAAPSIDAVGYLVGAESLEVETLDQEFLEPTPIEDIAYLTPEDKVAAFIADGNLDRAFADELRLAENGNHDFYAHLAYRFNMMGEKEMAAELLKKGMELGNASSIEAIETLKEFPLFSSFYEELPQESIAEVISDADTIDVASSSVLTPEDKAASFIADGNLDQAFSDELRLAENGNHDFYAHLAYRFNMMGEKEMAAELLKKGLELGNVASIEAVDSLQGLPSFQDYYDGFDVSVHSQENLALVGEQVVPEPEVSVEENISTEESVAQIIPDAVSKTCEMNLQDYHQTDEGNTRFSFSPSCDFGEGYTNPGEVIRLVFNGNNYDFPFESEVARKNSDIMRGVLQSFNRDILPQEYASLIPQFQGQTVASLQL